MSGDTLAFQLSDAGHRQLFTKTGYYKVVSVELCLCMAVCRSVCCSVCLPVILFLFALASVSVDDEFVSLLIYWLMHSFLLYVFFFFFVYGLMNWWIVSVSVWMTKYLLAD